MTVGFPDFGRQTVQSGPTAFRVTQIVTSIYQGPVTFFGYYAYVNLNLDFGTGLDFYQVSMQWYDDALGTLPTDIQYINIGPRMKGSIQLPALGSYFSLGIQPKAGTDTTSITVAGTASNGRAPSLRAAMQPGPLCTMSASIAASSTLTATATVIASGKVSWSVGNTGTGAWRFNILYWDFAAGAYTNFFQYAEGNTTIKSGNGNVIVPMAPLRIAVFNDDTAAHTFIASLTTGE